MVSYFYLCIYKNGYSSLAHSCGQISCSHENLPTKRYEWREWTVQLYLFVVPCAQMPVILWNFPKRNGILNACFQNGAFLLQSYTEMIKVPVFLTGHRCVYENKKWELGWKAGCVSICRPPFIWGFYSWSWISERISGCPCRLSADLLSAVLFWNDHFADVL